MLFESPILICGTSFCLKNKYKRNENTPEYKVPPHFQWSEQKESEE